MTALQFFPVGTNPEHWYAREPDGTPAGFIRRVHSSFQVHLDNECIAYHATLGAAQRRLARAYGKRFGT